MVVQWKRLDFKQSNSRVFTSGDPHTINTLKRNSSQQNKEWFIASEWPLCLSVKWRRRGLSLRQWQWRGVSQCLSITVKDVWLICQSQWRCGLCLRHSQWRGHGLLVTNCWSFMTNWHSSTWPWKQSDGNFSSKPVRLNKIQFRVEDAWPP